MGGGKLVTNLLQQVGLVPIKIGFHSLVLLWPVAEDRCMEGLHFYNCVAIKGGLKEQKQTGLTIQGVLNPQLTGKREAAGICLVPLFLVESTGVSVCSQRKFLFVLSVPCRSGEALTHLIMSKCHSLF